jgi:nucleoside 2-deoxyribosyltransferase
MGYDVVLPQDEASPLINKGVDAFRVVAEQCYRGAIECDIMVVVLDGADSDSGASLEAGARIGHYRAMNKAPRIIGVRTDFRRSEDRHLNAMFNLLDDLIFLESWKTEDPEELCGEIHKRIISLR